MSLLKDYLDFLRRRGRILLAVFLILLAALAALALITLPDPNSPFHYLSY